MRIPTPKAIQEVGSQRPGCLPTQTLFLECSPGHGITGPQLGQTLAWTEPSTLCSLPSHAHAQMLKYILCPMRKYALIQFHVTSPGSGDGGSPAWVGMEPLEECHVCMFVCSFLLTGGMGNCMCKKHEMDTVLGAESGCVSGPRLSMYPLRVPTTSQKPFLQHVFFLIRHINLTCGADNCQMPTGCLLLGTHKEHVCRPPLQLGWCQ